MFVSSSSGGG
ncbi:hypothetical protein ACHAW5_000897 [Stephanodiscus triporus]|uniref:Uncharacterized protein n=1 Tax=Stephanodiscus triporus TaxID=2934178 RepID=A0ABD3NJ53_9STRA